MPANREKSARLPAALDRSRHDSTMRAGARPEAARGETQAWVAAGLLAFLAIGGMLVWRFLAAGRAG